MAKQTFTTGQVLTAAQVNSLQANDFNQTVSVKTANYTLVAADKGTRIEFNTSGSVTCTVNTGLFDAGDTVIIQNRGSGTVTVTAGTATVNTNASLAVAQYGYGTLYFISASASIFFADAGGIPASAFTAKGDILVGTGSGTYDKLSVGANGTNIVADSSTSTGLKWAAAAAGGKVLQVIQDTLTSDFTATTGTPADSGLEVTITPSANTSKILIHYYFAARSFKSGSSNNNYGYFDLYDGTNVLQEYAFGVINHASSTDKYNDGTISGVYLDSPATTSARTYKIRVFTGDSTQMTVKAAATRIASIVAMEIGA